jgi:hypothetical protein
MPNAIVLAGNAETHPQASMVVGVIVVIAVVVLVVWLTHRR